MDSPGSKFLRLSDLLSTEPMAAAAYRALKARNNRTELPEERSVPFLRSVAFPLLLAVYLTVARLVGLLTRAPPPGGSFDHVFTVTSAAGYRSWPQLSVARRLARRGHDVCIISTPSADSRRQEWEGIAPVYPHRSLHQHLPVRRTIAHLADAFRITSRLFSTLQIPRSELRTFSMCANLVYLELIKHASVQDLMRGTPVIHTMKPDPYLLTSSPPEHIIVYQHGMIHVNGAYEWPGIPSSPTYPFTMAIPYFAPVRYAVWDALSAREYQKVVHEQAQIAVTGSPWHDRVAASRSGDAAAVDVLFLSQPELSGDSDRIEALLGLVDRLVGYATDRDLRFAIREHPRGQGSYLRGTRHERHIAQFSDVNEAIRRSLVVVTNTSSSLYEAAALQTPIVLTDLFDQVNPAYAGYRFIHMIDGVDDLPGVLTELLEGSGHDDRPSLGLHGDSVERIIEISQQTNFEKIHS
jgi:hypothetical protein